MEMQTIRTFYNTATVMDPTPSTCTAILTKGLRRGSQCGRQFTPDDDETFCKLHVVKTVQIELCQVLLVKGKRKNQSCNRKAVAALKDHTLLCKLHCDLEVKRPYNPYIHHEYELTLLDDERVYSDNGSLLLSRLHPTLVPRIHELFST